ncbi:MAG TPA: hypothetical protein DEH78_05210 [Solibacterales bacterium]|nr:hypothetical protein [Bryobacterales bacterium]
MWMKLTIRKGRDGWRWNMRPLSGGRIIGASTQGYARQDQARHNCFTVTGFQIGLVTGGQAEIHVDTDTRDRDWL